MLLRAMVQNLKIEDDKIKYKTLENQFINLDTKSEKAEGKSLPSRKRGVKKARKII
jgi:hypothetical protein